MLSILKKITGNISTMVVLGIIAAFLAPHAASWLYWALIPLIIVLLYTSLLPVKITMLFKITRGDLKLLFASLFLQFIVVGIIGLIFAKLLIKDPVFADALILSAIMPTGVMNIFFVRMAGGSVSLALYSVLAATLAAPFIIPAWAVLFAGASVQISILDIFSKTAFIVFIPLFFAWLTQKNSAITKKITANLKPVNFSLFFIVIFIIVGPSVDYIISNIDDVIALVIPVGLTLAFSILAGYLTIFWHKDEKKRVAFMVISGRKNLAICYGLAVLFPPQFILPVIIYTILHNIWVGALDINKNKRYISDAVNL